MRLMELFTDICNKSIAVSYVILVVLALRFVFDKMKLPKKYSYYLWAIPLIRFIFPVSISSVFSLFNVVRRVPEVHVPDSGYIPFQMQELISGAGAGDAAPAVQNAAVHSVNSMRFLPLILFAVIWIIGISVFCVYSVLSYVRIRRTVRRAVLLKDNIYECSGISSPFVMGIFSPKIYIPFHMQAAELAYILRHERFHIERRDHIVKMLYFTVTVVYWFQPLAWIAFFCMGRDMEMSCDERILIEMGDGIKENYSMSLLSFATNRRMRFAGPLAFGETDTRRRIRNVLNFRKPKTWFTLIGVILILAAALVCLTGRKENQVQAAALTEGTLSENSAAGDENAQGLLLTDTGADSESSAVSEATGSVQAFVTRWANAFCGRDGETILSLTTDDGRKALEADGMLMEEEGSYMFGFSSPWPVGDGSYRILGMNESGAEILYYAWTSDPHLTVWRESLTLQMTEDGYRTSDDSIEEFGQIASPDEFFRAYPGGVISGTMMDYEANGLGEALNQHAKEPGANEYYRGLLDPEQSARYLLNLLLDDHKVSVEFQEDTQAVQIKFSELNAMISVAMIQPYGEDGIWIPCSYESSGNLLAENREEGISVYGLFSEDGEKSRIKFDISSEEVIFDCDWDYAGHFNKLKVYERTEGGTPQAFAFTMLYQNTGTSEVWRMFVVNRDNAGEFKMTEFLPQDYMAQAREMTELVIEDGVLKIWGNGKALDKEAVPADAGGNVEAVLLDNLVFMDADEEGLKLMLAAGYQEDGKIIMTARHPVVFKIGYKDHVFTLEDAEVDADMNVKMWE